MKISVVIPAYNGEKFIRQCIQSVLNQTRKPDQIAVIIDESHDRTQTACEEFDDQIEIYHNSPATGFVDAWNRAIGKAKYEWICLLHQDDLIREDFFAKAEKIMAENPDIRFIYGRCDYIDNNGKSYWTPTIYGPEWQKQSGEEYIMSYMAGDANRCPGVIAHKDVFTQIPFRKEPGLVADNDFFWRVGFHYDVIRINAIEASFRHHPDSATHSFKNLDVSMFEEYMWLYRDYSVNDFLTKFPAFEKVLAEWIFKHFSRYALTLLGGNHIHDFLVEKNKIQSFVYDNKIRLHSYHLKLSEKICCMRIPWIIPWSAETVYKFCHKRK